MNGAPPQPNAPQNRPEKTPGEKFLENRYLIAGNKIKLVKVFNPQESIEGVLDEDVVLGNPIVFNQGAKSTSPITGVAYENDKVFFKTDASTYELVPPTGESEYTKIDTEELRAKEKEIEELLKKAQNAAVDSQVTRSLFQKKINLQTQPQTKEVQEELKEINTELEKHRVSVKTLIEFKILMEKTGKNYYIVKNTIEHENAHANKAASLDAIHGGYSLLVLKNGDKFSYQPIALTKPPEDWEEKRKIETSIKIGSAPSEYGNRTSAGDEQQIAKLRERLKNL